MMVFAGRNRLIAGTRTVLGAGTRDTNYSAAW
jgi:hypothetical protein